MRWCAICQIGSSNCVFVRMRDSQLRRLLKEIELMISLADQCLEVVQHGIEQHEKR